MRRRVWVVAAALGGVGCSFTPPDLSPTADAAVDAVAIDAVPDGAYVPACLNDPTYTAGPEHRYKVIAQARDYDSAIDACTADGAHVAVIDSEVENTYVRGLIGGDAWIGYDDLTVEGTFRWLTGAQPGYRAFTPEEPNNANGSEDCTYVRPNGTWNDTNCQDAKRTVCECDPAYRPPATPECRMTIAGSTTADGRRLFVRAVPAAWAVAEADCASIGAHLAIISDLQEDNAINARVVGDGWIGYSDLDVEDTFQWVNGAPAGYTRWRGGGQPQSNATEDCVIVDELGEWSARACTELHLYACECDPSPP